MSPARSMSDLSRLSFADALDIRCGEPRPDLARLSREQLHRYAIELEMRLNNFAVEAIRAGRPPVESPKT